MGCCESALGPDADRHAKALIIVRLVECAPRAGQDKAAVLIVCGAWSSSNWSGLRCVACMRLRMAGDLDRAFPYANSVTIGRC